MDVISVIRTKRDRGRLSDEQIDWVIDAYTKGVVADEQMSALAMAILLNGMDRAEIARWTAAMINSGERMDFSALPRPTADKHSTGGGRLVAFTCVDRAGNLLMPCGRCRQLLWEHGGPGLLVEMADGIRTMRDVLPDAFGPEDLINR